MHGMGHHHRFRHRCSAVLAVVLVLLVPACGTSSGDGGPAIPFTDALVEQDADRYSVTWQGDGSGDVTVYAGTDPTAVGRDREVGRGGERGELTVVDLPEAPRWYFELVPEHGEALVLADRSLHLESAPNFRDVGGYRTEDGRWVRMGLVYRSDGLEDLSDVDRSRIRDIGINLVCDLRTDGEREGDPDPDIEGVTNEVFNVAADSGNLTKVITDAILSGDTAVQHEMLGDGKGERLLLDGGRELVSGETARGAYARIFDRLSEKTVLPAVFHCTAGKDRTGWAAAALLTALGVPRPVVEADYLRSNEALADETQHTLDRVGGLIDVALLEPVLGVRAEYLAASFDEVDQVHDGIDGYLADGIAVDADQRQRLEALLLAG